jgi:hypothetical protein
VRTLAGLIAQQASGEAYGVGHEVKDLAWKNLERRKQDRPVPFDDYAERMLEEARSEYRRWLLQQRRLHQLRLWAS